MLRRPRGSGGQGRPRSHWARHMKQYRVSLIQSPTPRPTRRRRRVYDWHSNWSTAARTTVSSLDGLQSVDGTFITGSKGCLSGMRRLGARTFFSETDEASGRTSEELWSSAYSSRGCSSEDGGSQHSPSRLSSASQTCTVTPEPPAHAHKQDPRRTRSSQHGRVEQGCAETDSVLQGASKDCQRLPGFPSPA